MTDTIEKRLLKSRLIEAGLIKYGLFELSSGGTAKTYVDPYDHWEDENPTYINFLRDVEIVDVVGLGPGPVEVRYMHG